MVFKAVTSPGEERNLLLLSAVELRFLCDPPHRPGTVPTAQSKGSKMQIYFEVYPIFKDMIRVLIEKTCYCRYVQGGSNMTGNDLYINKPHCAASVRP